jgi:5-methylcytosine-specific restriction enzyme A
MQFTPAEFLAFAKATQHDRWETLKQGKPFQFTVSNIGITILPTGGTSRSVANSEVVEFCSVFGRSLAQEQALKKKIFNSSYLFAIASKYSLDRTDFRFPEEITVGSLREGATRIVEVNAFERNPEARRRCIEAHGTSCVVCEFSFGKVYGDFARDFIHVHHLNPLAAQQKEHEVDPICDLRPVCPNCHSVIHMRNGCLSIDEAKAMLCKDRNIRCFVPRD